MVEVQGSLVSTAAWLTGPKHVLLGNSSRSFAVKASCCAECLLASFLTAHLQIDKSGLRPGVHYAECQLLDSRHPTAGPLVRVPITVVVPEVLVGQALNCSYSQMGPGDIKVSKHANGSRRIRCSRVALGALCDGAIHCHGLPGHPHGGRHQQGKPPALAPRRAAQPQNRLQRDGISSVG